MLNDFENQLSQNSNADESIIDSSSSFNWNDFLAKANPNCEVTIKDYAKLKKKTVKTVKNWIKKGQLPPPIKQGHESYWFVKTILDFESDALEKKRLETEKQRKRIQLLKVPNLRS